MGVKRLISSAACLLGLAGASFAHGSTAGNLPPHFELVEVTGNWFSKLVGMTFAPDGTLFAWEKVGRIRFHDGNDLQSTYFINLSDEIVGSGDRGMLGVELHPGFLPDGGPTSWVYMLYTVSPVFGEDPLYNADEKYAWGRLRRYRAITLPNGDVVADLASRQTLIGTQLPDGSVPDGFATPHSSHAIGTLAFADDGSLLVSAGDGADWSPDFGGEHEGAFTDVTHPVTGLVGPTPAEQDSGSFRSQDMRSIAGKILRIDPETGLGYPSNPFFDGDVTSNASKVWALGLRQPYRMNVVPNTGALDPSLGQPNQLFIGEVGRSTWEELNVCNGGENFGWPCWEGPFPHGSFEFYQHPEPNTYNFPDCSNMGPGVLTQPLVAWHHSDPSQLTPGGVHYSVDDVQLSGFDGDVAVAGDFYLGESNYPIEYDGRYFFADYSEDWIKTLELDAQGNVVAIRDFIAGIDEVVDLERNPLTGDIYIVQLNPLDEGTRISRLRYGLNLSPIATATGNPAYGDAPLAVSFTGDASIDPEGDDITYAWDFKDGSPISTEMNPSHVYTTDGIYEVELTVTDTGGLSSTDEVQVVVGETPPLASILSPVSGQVFTDSELLSLSGLGSDIQGEIVDYSWTIDLYHDTHIHPDFVSLTGQNTSLLLDEHGDAGDVIYLRVRLTVEDSAGLTAESHVFIYPDNYVYDVTGTANAIALVDTLSPPGPQGTGNLDIEIIRDGHNPPVGSTNRLLQFDTFHDGDQGDDDWVGWELTSTPGVEARFIALEFQEGIHYAGGGWFEDMDVEVRSNNKWTPVTKLVIDPAYPFQLAGNPGFDGQSFETYTLSFDPQWGDAIRLRGTPGGDDGFISVGELRARMVDVYFGCTGEEDLSAAGSITARVFELSPPFPLGSGSLDQETIRNGTLPPAGSTSLLGQVDTFHNGDQGTLDWIGYSYPNIHNFTRMTFQEGIHFPNGGWFDDDFTVETRINASTPWIPVFSPNVTPRYSGVTTQAESYETFDITFPPSPGREIRISGVPGGTDSFISVGELRVFSPSACDDCGFTAYGTGLGGANQMTLESATAPLIGHPAAFETRGATSLGNGVLAFSIAPSAFPLFGGTVLIDGGSFILLPMVYNTSGDADFLLPIPGEPAISGLSVYFQSVWFNPGNPDAPLLSNGLEMKICGG